MVLIKPDAVNRRIAGQIIQRFENSGIKLHAMKLIHPTVEQASAHYEEHREKVFFKGSVEYLSASPVIALVLGGLNGISKIRSLTGATCPSKALPGTIRGDFSHTPVGGAYIVCNLIHASSSPEDATRELNLWFTPQEIVDYETCDELYHGNIEM